MRRASNPYATACSRARQQLAEIDAGVHGQNRRQDTGDFQTTMSYLGLCTVMEVFFRGVLRDVIDKDFIAAIRSASDVLSRHMKTRWCQENMVDLHACQISEKQTLGQVWIQAKRCPELRSRDLKQAVQSFSEMMIPNRNEIAHTGRKKHKHAYIDAYATCDALLKAFESGTRLA